MSRFLAVLSLSNATNQNPILVLFVFILMGARCSSVVRVFAHGAMGHRIDPSWWTH